MILPKLPINTLALSEIITISSGNLSDLNIDVTKDWAAFGITNLGALDLFTTVANSISNVEFINNWSKTSSNNNMIFPE